MIIHKYVRQPSYEFRPSPKAIRLNVDLRHCGRQNRPVPESRKEIAQGGDFFNPVPKGNGGMCCEDEVLGNCGQLFRFVVCLADLSVALVPSVSNVW